MQMIVKKSSSVGTSGIFAADFQLQSRCFFHYFFKLPALFLSEGYIAVFVGQIARVHDFMPLAGQVQKPYYVPIVNQCAADIINLPSLVFSIGVRKECGVRKIIRPGRDVDEIALWTSPDGMEFSFDKYTGVLPDSPTKYVLSAELGSPLFHDYETFILLLREVWLADDRNWAIFRDNFTTETDNVGRAQCAGV